MYTAHEHEPWDYTVYTLHVYVDKEEHFKSIPLIGHFCTLSE